nr:hypothetical protein CFP56_73316 [Quercus suber]
MSSRSLESMVEEGAELRSGRVPKNRDTSVQTVSGRNEARTRDQDLENMNTEMSNTIEQTVQDGWDNMEKVEKVLAHVKEIYVADEAGGLGIQKRFEGIWSWVNGGGGNIGYSPSGISGTIFGPRSGQGSGAGVDAGPGGSGGQASGSAGGGTSSTGSSSSSDSGKV